MPQAIGYIRVSDQRQAEDGSSLSTQEKLVRNFAEAKGYRLTRLFIEEGESAKTDARPQLQEMLRYCRNHSGENEILILPKIDRLARNALDYANLKRAFAKHGVRLESIGERIEDTPVGRFTETIMASVAQFDNEIRAERSKSGMIEAVSEGRWVWKAPKGYRNVRFNGKGTIEPKLGEAEHISRAFSFLAERSASVQWVRQWLSNHDITLSTSQLYQMVRNRVYTGQIVAFGSVHAGKPPFLPLVSETTFLAAGLALRTQLTKSGYNRENSDFPVRGTVRCPCGRLLTASWSRGRKMKYAYYRCNSCSNVNLAKAVVEEQFAVELQLFSPTPDVWEGIEAAVRLRWRERGILSEAKSKSATEKIDVLFKLQKALALKNASGVIPDDVAKTQIDELSTKIGELSQGIFQAKPGISLEEALAFSKRFLTDLGLRWAGMPLNAKRAIQTFLYPNGITYVAESGYRTGEYVLLEEIKRVLREGVSCVVSQDLDCTNQTTLTQDSLLGNTDPLGESDLQQVFDWIVSLESYLGERQKE